LYLVRHLLLKHLITLNIGKVHHLAKNTAGTAGCKPVTFEGTEETDHDKSE
jgi:hypothetical protein